MNEVLETNIFHHDNFKVNLQYYHHHSSWFTHDSIINFDL